MQIQSHKLMLPLLTEFLIRRRGRSNKIFEFQTSCLSKTHKKLHINFEREDVNFVQYLDNKNVSIYVFASFDVMLKGIRMRLFKSIDIFL